MFIGLTKRSHQAYGPCKQMSSLKVISVYDLKLLLDYLKMYVNLNG